MRVGQKNGLVYQWAKKGTRPRQPKDQRYENAYLLWAAWSMARSGYAGDHERRPGRADGDGHRRGLRIPNSDFVELGSLIKFEDDGPDADINLTASATIVLDETDNDADDNNVGGILATSTVLAANLFTDSSVFGSDGFLDADDNNVQDALAKVFSLTLTAGATGLTDTLSGDAVVLTQAVPGGPIEGHALNGGGPLVFTISVDAVSGDVTVTQNRAVVHGNPNDPDEAATPEIMNGGLVELTVTVTDGDLDSDSDFVELGSLIKFEDDGPDADINLTASATIVLDETDNDADDNNVGGILATSTVLAANLFTDSSVFGSDGFLDADDNNVQDALAKVFSLTLTAGATGLTDTLSGDAVVLTQAVPGGPIEGHALNGGGPLVFTISVDAVSGDVTVTQNRAVVHGNPNDPDEAATPEIMNGGLVELTVTVTDGDFDSDSDFVELGSLIKFEDDGPIASDEVAQFVSGQQVVDAILDDEDQAFGIQAGAGDDGSGTTVSGQIDFNAGSDGLQQIAFSTLVTATGSNNGAVFPLEVVVVNPVTKVAHQETISFQWVDNGAGGTLIGFSASYPAVGNPVLTLQVFADGTYDLDINAPLAHPFTDPDFGNNGPETEFEDNLQLEFTYTVTDGDGDTATATLTVNVDDDTPDALNDTATVDEGGVAQDLNICFVLDFSGSISDTNFNIMLNAVTDAGEALFANASGDVSITVVRFANGANTIGTYTDFVTFEAALNINDDARGVDENGTDYTAAIEQAMASFAPNPAANNQVLFFSDGEPNQNTGAGHSLELPTQTAWNLFVGNNDINVQTIGVAGATEAALQDVDEADADNTVILIDDFDDLIDALIDAIGPISTPVSGNVLLGSDNMVSGDDDRFGADGGRILSIEIDETTYTWNGTNTVTPTGDPVPPGTVIGSNNITVDTDIGGTFSFNFSTGAWSYSPPASVGDDEIETFTYSIVDGDGDGQTADLTITVKDVNDPLVVSGTVIGTVEEEDGLPGGIEDANAAPDLDTDNAPAINNISTGSFGLLIDPAGIDGPLSFTISTFAGNPAVQTVSNGPLTSDGNPVLFHRVDGDTLIGYTNTGPGGAGFGADDTTIFTLQLTGPTTGAYTFTLQQPVDHPVDVPATEDNIVINLNDMVRVTDTGGPHPVDTNVPLDALITVIDDVPVTEDNNRTVEAGSLNTVDIQLIVDVSGSMDDDFINVPGADLSDNRIGLARYAMRELIEDNPQIQNVQFVKFSDSVSSTVWLSRTDAITYINTNANWTLINTTNYDIALQEAIDEYNNSSRPLGVSDETVVAFLSDGVPNEPSDEGITTEGGAGNVSIAEWETHVTTAVPPITNVFAVGIGPSVNTSVLEPISYPNTDGPDAGTVEDNVILVPNNNVQAFVDAFGGVVSAPSSITGNVLVDDPSLSTGADAFGADGAGYIKSITINGVVYTFNGVGTVTETGVPPAGYDDNGTWIVVPTALGGEITFYFADTGPNDAGDWSYLAPTSTTGPESFEYALVDNDGDNVPADLNITVVPPAPTYSVADAAAVVEGNQLAFTITLSNPSAGAITLDLQAIMGGAPGATPTSDFEITNFTYVNGGPVLPAGGINGTRVTFAAGTTVLTVFVDTVNDIAKEVTENVTLQVVSVVSGTVAGSGNDATGNGQILDNDNQAPLGVTDNVFLNDDVSVVLQNNWLLANDTDGDADPLTVESAADGPNANVTAVGATTTTLTYGGGTTPPAALPTWRPTGSRTPPTPR